MNTYQKHAMKEFKAAGWLNEDLTFKDDMQGMICQHVLKLLDVFADEGHSGSSAPYTISLFSKLASFEPIVPLTGEDWEWNEVGPGLFQNSRCSHVFKEAGRFNGQAYDIEGKIFWSWEEYDLEPGEEGYPGVYRYKSSYTSGDSRVPITFPYTPSKEYVEVMK